MYSVIKNVISTGGYDLTSILKKINSVWFEEHISDEQKAELTELARNGANANASIDVINKLLDLEKRVAVLEKIVEALEGTEDTTEEYAEFVVGKSYYNGDNCSFNGVNYTCIAPEGAVCVWSPIDYPAYWEAVK
jgi:hypothetical protein